ncbi:hypothetical protein TP2_09035 [Thioclava pacifica DSM 10166]|uniref:Co-chaperone DjlA N-terminal domain-containing protein n=2 Tax=Thioclava pacifica TaxID=285109 RepID=A0A074J955_9RHOB|nr:hypothetical protein TP2_09035 [Thioclava pacifica DSM 10166]
MAFCALKTETSLFGLPVWYSPKGYALAANRCTATRFDALSSDKVLAGQIAQVFPENLPDVPPLTLVQKLTGYVSYALAAVLLLLVLRSLFRLRSGAKTRGAGPRELSLLARRIIEVAASTAMADGALTDEDLTRIADVTARVTGEPCDPADIVDIAGKARGTVKTKDFKSFAKGLDTQSKEQVLRAAMMVAMADRSFRQTKIAFIAQLSKAFNISPERRTALLHGSAVPA